MSTGFKASNNTFRIKFTLSAEDRQAIEARLKATGNGRSREAIREFLAECMEIGLLDLIESYRPTDEGKQ